MATAALSSRGRRCGVARRSFPGEGQLGRRGAVGGGGSAGDGDEARGSGRR
jgi:hypothetical protein